MANTEFTSQIEQMVQRVQRLYQSAVPAQQHSTQLISAFVELDTALNLLRAIENALQRADIALADVAATMSTEHQRYQEMFELAPIAYLVTSLDGMIRRANRAAAILLQSTQKDLIRQSFTSLIPADQRSAFRRRFSTIRTLDQVQRWEFQLQPRTGAAIAIEATIAIARIGSGQPTNLYWLLRDKTVEEQEREVRGAKLEQLERYIGQLAAID